MNESDQVPPQLPTCPNCGAPIPDSKSYCPRCGYSQLAPESPTKSNSCLQILLILVFAGVALPVAAVGTCFLAFSQGDSGLLAVGIGALVLSILVTVLLIRALKKT